VEPRSQLLQCLIGHDPQRTQRMVRGNSLLRVDVAEHVQLLLVFSAHAFFLSVRSVETREFSGSISVFPHPARETTSGLNAALAALVGVYTVVQTDPPQYLTNCQESEAVSQRDVD